MEMFTGKEYLKIAIANHFGMDKKNWSERIAWTDEHYEELEQIALSGEAEEPAEMLGAVQALRKTENGFPTGFPVGLDATCSCLQLSACLTNDVQAMQYCNVIGTKKREDAYQIVYDDMCDHLGSKGNLKRKQIKQAVMTSVYGSSAKPKEVFGDKSKEYYQFQDSMNHLFPRVWKLNDIMLDHWNSRADEYNWVMPDNFHVKIEVFTTETLKAKFDGHTEYFQHSIKGAIPKGRSLGANLIHSVDAYVLREMVRRTNYDKEWIDEIKAMRTRKRIDLPKDTENINVKQVNILLKYYQETGLISQRITDYIRPYTVNLIPDDVLDLVLSRFAPKPFKMLTIHDCFRVHANYCNELRSQYINLLAELAESNLLDTLCYEINKFKPKFNHIAGIGQKIRETSNYALS